MPDGLTYLGQKCVLEFLEANKRIHISSRCPYLKQIDHGVPFHINTLVFHKDWIIVNKFGYHLREEEESDPHDPRNQLVEGDVLIGSKIAFWSRKYPKIGFYNNLRQVADRRVPERDSKIMETHVAIKKMYEILFGERRHIWVDRLKFSLQEPTILRLPVGFNVRTRKLDSGELNPEYFICLLHPSSFPLHELTLKSPEKLNQPIVLSSAKLIIHEFILFPQRRMENLMMLEHSNVTVVDSGYTPLDFYRVIEYWLNHRQGTSACFKWTATGKKSCEIM
ncbi:hypothetical protein CRE_22649 [Caenorhabditis remanei]|uniref:F-box associated domain-containing protein n=1 Tax=Caenorhabditis remanei TaxID=31234 RepID=E3N8R3_CAERE|nr:hypothetical protein CRE_22649 [Caenorhabditis remanei]